MSFHPIAPEDWADADIFPGGLEEFRKMCATMVSDSSPRPATTNRATPNVAGPILTTPALPERTFPSPFAASMAFGFPEIPQHLTPRTLGASTWPRDLSFSHGDSEIAGSCSVPPTPVQQPIAISAQHSDGANGLTLAEQMNPYNLPQFGLSASSPQGRSLFGTDHGTFQLASYLDFRQALPVILPHGNPAAEHTLEGPARKKPKNELPAYYILGGQGSRGNDHPGNREYLVVVRAERLFFFLPDYFDLKKSVHRKLVADQVVWYCENCVQVENQNLVFTDGSGKLLTEEQKQAKVNTALRSPSCFEPTDFVHDIPVDKAAYHPKNSMIYDETNALQQRIKNDQLTLEAATKALFNAIHQDGGHIRMYKNARIIDQRGWITLSKDASWEVCKNLLSSDEKELQDAVDTFYQEVKDYALKDPCPLPSLEEYLARKKQEETEFEEVMAGMEFLGRTEDENHHQQQHQKQETEEQQREGGDYGPFVNDLPDNPDFLDDDLSFLHDLFKEM